MDAIVRLGTEYGGWWIPENILTKDSICYSAGAGEDISFDVALSNKYACEVFLFDPTPRALKHFEELRSSVKRGEKFAINRDTENCYECDSSAFERLTFLDIGVASEDKEIQFYAPENPAHVSHSIDPSRGHGQSFTAECQRVSSIMEKLGHTSLDLLKLDIEGAEFEVLDSLLTDKISPRILCVEFHSDGSFSSKYRDFQIKRKLKKHGYLLLKNNETDYSFLLSK